MKWSRRSPARPTSRTPRAARPGGPRTASIPDTELSASGLPRPTPGWVFPRRRAEQPGRLGVHPVAASLPGRRRALEPEGRRQPQFGALARWPSDQAGDGVPAVCGFLQERCWAGGHCLQRRNVQALRSSRTGRPSRSPHPRRQERGIRAEPGARSGRAARAGRSRGTLLLSAQQQGAPPARARLAIPSQLTHPEHQSSHP